MHFDAQTGFLYISAMTFVMALAIWVLLRGERAPSAPYWVAGGFAIALGSLLTYARDSLGPYGFVAAPLVVGLSYFLKIHALRLEAGASLSWPGLALPPMLYAAAAWYLSTFSSSPLPYSHYVSLTLLALNAWLASWAFHLWRRQGIRSAFWIALAHAIWILFYGFRAIMVSLGYFEPAILSQDWSAILLAMAAILTAVISNLGYLGIALERSIRARVASAAAQARAEENQRLSEQLAQLDRQRCIGTMSASLGHEINQPLAAILTHAQIVQRGLPSPEPDQATPLRDSLERIVDSTRRATQIIERIRNFIRPQETRHEPLVLAQLTADIVKLIAAEARAQQVSVRLAPNPPAFKIMGDPVQLSQILINLLRNAIEAMAESDRREIHISLIDMDGKQARLRIRDTGPGLSESVLKQVGEPFFTTKDSGLGMGLSISQTLAEQHGGTLTLTNAEDGGAVAELNIPILDSDD